MQEENVIVVDNITKSFKVYLDKGKTLKERLVSSGRGNYQTREVLKGVSFQVRRGEAIGLIGKNGCGKSTTLKMLTRIIYPDSGRIEIKGKVSSLLELGAGFHPDMSGRENIYLNASIFGLTKKEIDRKVNEIITFSELEEFIDNPVRTYSSGMYMRLAFSVAINVNAEILLIDEILGVGDVSFQKKCFERLQEIKGAGATIVIVSHSLEQLERICDRCIWIYDGLVREEGTPVTVNAHYYREMEEQRLQRCKQEDELQGQVAEEGQVQENVGEEKSYKNTIEDKEMEVGEYGEEVDKNSQSEEKVEEEQKTKDEGVDSSVKEEKKKLPAFLDKTAIRVGSGEGQFTWVSLRNLRDNDHMIFSIGDSMEVRFKVRSEKCIKGTNISVSISRDDGLYCYGTNTGFDDCENIDLDEVDKEIVFRFNNMRLLAGKYYINLGLYDKSNNEYDVIWNAKKFYIKDENPSGEIGVYQMEHQWYY